MLSRGIRKYISNPALGLTPCILYNILQVSKVNEAYALIISLVVAVAGELILRVVYKSRIFSMVFFVSWVSLTITFILWFLTKEYANKPNTYIIICEILIVCIFMLLRLSKTFIITKFFRKKNLFQKALFNEFFESVRFIQYGLTLHLFGLLLFRQFTLYISASRPVEIFLFAICPILIVFTVGLYQALKISKLSARLQKEEWLPIVTEKGEVTGKIAKNVSLSMKNKFMHPIVRVALIANSKVYLQEKPINDILSPKKLDYPFEKYMLFNHEINLAARNSLKMMLDDEMIDTPINFLLKYVFENENTKRLIFLFVTKIDDENKIRRNNKMHGKFWSIKQIEESFPDEIFSECFELEYEYIKNMILSPTDIFGEKNKDSN